MLLLQSTMGWTRVRFLAWVKAGARVRLRVTLMELEQEGASSQGFGQATADRRRSSRPGREPEKSGCGRSRALQPIAAEKGRTSGTLHKEESMATQSFLDMIEEFGTGLGVPKVDVDKLIEVHRRNIDALGRSAQVATEGAKSLADKQREIIETAFRETSAMMRDFKPTGNPQEMLVKQTEFAKKAFDMTLQNTRDIAELAMKATSDATAIVRARLRESLSEVRNSRESRGQRNAQEEVTACA